MTPQSGKIRVISTDESVLPTSIACSMGSDLPGKMGLDRAKICGRADRANRLGVVDKLS